MDKELMAKRQAYIDAVYLAEQRALELGAVAFCCGMLVFGKPEEGADQCPVRTSGSMPGILGLAEMMKVNAINQQKTQAPVEAPGAVH